MPYGVPSSSLSMNRHHFDWFMFVLFEVVLGRVVLYLAFCRISPACLDFAPSPLYPSCPFHCATPQSSHRALALTPLVSSLVASDPFGAHPHALRLQSREIIRLVGSLRHSPGRRCCTVVRPQMLHVRWGRQVHCDCGYERFH
jgi:hypothetical protein